MTITDALGSQLDRLASFDAGPYPVVSLYLNMQPDEHGRDHFDPFLRKELAARLATYPADGPERTSLEQDAARILTYVGETRDPSANGLALFACNGGGLFEAVQLAAPINEHQLYVSDQPQLYPLARLVDEYPKYAVVLADSHTARIMVFAARTMERAATVNDVKTRRHKMGGWSQARYQRRVDEFRAHHAKETIGMLERIVREERIGAVVLAGDEVILPLLRDNLPKDVSARVVDILKLDIRAPVDEIIEASSALLRRNDAQSDQQRVEALLGEYRAGGLASVGVEATQKAFDAGQVDELLIAAQPEAIHSETSQDSNARPGTAPANERIASALVAAAHKTGARISFIEDASLLEPVGGVGAFLRFKL